MAHSHITYRGYQTWRLSRNPKNLNQGDFGADSFTKPQFKVTSAEVVII